MDDRPIGVLDSGVGGLTIWKEILLQHPLESTVYIGDSKNAPYGKRTPEDIRSLASQMITFLLKKDAKLIVVACNTITVNGIDIIRSQFPNTPIVGTVPVVKMAAQVSKNKKIGVLVTGATANSQYNQLLIEKFAPDCEVVTIGTNALVPLIEAHKNKDLPTVIARELLPFIKKGVDTVVLGSTHFPILRQPIQDFLGERVHVLDSAGAVARQVGRILENNKIKTSPKKPTHAIFTTGKTAPFTQILKQIIGQSALAKQAVLQYTYA